MGERHYPNSGDREDYLNYYRKWIADARAVSDEIGEPLELVMPLLCVNTIIAKLSDHARFIASSFADPEMRELRRRILADLKKAQDEPWKEE